MDYGVNILSKQPADWEATNGTVTNSGIVLDALGVASIKLTTAALKSIPESLKLIVIADPMTDVYEPTLYAVLKVTYSDTNIVHYHVPLIDIGNGICTVEIPTAAASHKECVFYFTTTYAVTIRDWSLSAPIVDDNEAALDEMREEIPKLLADHNTYTITIGQQEDVIALISARLLENTDVNGHLQITFVASSACVVTLRIKDNDGTELFAPILYNVAKGRSSIGVPHAYMNRLLGMHTFKITAQCSTGTLTFYTRSIMYTIDAGHLAKRVMDTGYDVQDIAICQLPEDSSPSKIYAIGIDDDGIARVRYRAYSENAAVVWEPAFSVEEAIAAAIEFDGNFVRRTGDMFYTLECYANPFVFWITPTGELYVQTGSDTTTRVHLASKVSAVSAVRGFKSELYPEQDQGVIVAYVVDGIVYYRNYCMQVTGKYLWEYEKCLDQLGTGIVRVHVHRLNDYRVGFVATNAEGHTWIISSRTYVNAAFPPEQVYVSPESPASMAIYHRRDTVPSVSVDGSASEDLMLITLSGNMPLVPFGTFNDVFDFGSGSNQTYLHVKRMYQFGNDLCILLSKPAKAGIMYLVPKYERLKAYDANHGYIAVPPNNIRVEIGLSRTTTKFSESFEVTAGLTASITQKSVLPTTVTAPIEQFEIEADLGAIIYQKTLSTSQTSFEDSFSVEASLSATITQAFVGASPI